MACIDAISCFYKHSKQQLSQIRQKSQHREYYFQFNWNDFKLLWTCFSITLRTNRNWNLDCPIQFGRIWRTLPNFDLKSRLHSLSKPDSSSQQIWTQYRKSLWHYKQRRNFLRFEYSQPRWYYIVGLRLPLRRYSYHK